MKQKQIHLETPLDKTDDGMSEHSVCLCMYAGDQRKNKIRWCLNLGWSPTILVPSPKTSPQGRNQKFISAGAFFSVNSVYTLKIVSFRLPFLPPLFPASNWPLQSSYGIWEALLASFSGGNA